MTQDLDSKANWDKLLKIGGIAAIIIVSIIPVQIIIFALFPPPDSPVGFFELFGRNPLLGLLSLDFLYVINNSVMIFLYLGLFAALKKTNFTYMLIAIVVGLIGITAYYSSTVAFEMMSISKQYNLAESAELKQQFISAGHTLLAVYKGTAFDVYYVLNAITLLLISRVMFMDNTFSKTTAVFGLTSGIFMIIPSTAGQIGLIFSLLSLIPWVVFSILVAKRLFVLYNKRQTVI